MAKLKLGFPYLVKVLYSNAASTDTTLTSNMTTLTIDVSLISLISIISIISPDEVFPTDVLTNRVPLITIYVSFIHTFY